MADPVINMIFITIYGRITNMSLHNAIYIYIYIYGNKHSSLCPEIK